MSDRLSVRAGSYASMLAASLRPREMWWVPNFMESSGLYIAHPNDPEEEPLKVSGGLADTPQSLTVVPGDSPTANFALLQAAITAAESFTPNGSALGASNYAHVYALPALYDGGSGGNLMFSNPYINLYGLAPDPMAVHIKATRSTDGGTVRQTADHIGLYNLALEIAGSSENAAAYWPDPNKPGTVLQDIRIIVSGSGRAMRPSMPTGMGAVDIEYSGTYRRVKTASGLFRGYESSGTVLKMSGLFEECEGGDGSFGGNASGGLSNTLISGTLRRCIGGRSSFWSGADGSDATGVIEDCVAQTHNGSGEYSSFNVKAATLRRVRLAGEGAGIGATTDFVGMAEDCVVRLSGGNRTAIRVAAAARVYGGTYIGTGTAKSIDAASSITAAIAHVRTNKGIGVNITNNIGTPYNVDDADLS